MTKKTETISYIEPQVDIFVGESILNAANNVFDFKKFKREQQKLLKKKAKKAKQLQLKTYLKNTKL